MSCLDTYRNEHNKSQFTAHQTGPRISFSSDFAMSDQEPRVGGGGSYREAPVSSDFEFSVADFSTASADEMFFKGRLLPLKDATRKVAGTTLRDEIMADAAEEEAEFVSRPSFLPTGWRGLLGLKKASVSKKSFGLVSTEGNSACVIPQVEDEQVDENGTGPNCMDTDLGL